MLRSAELPVRKLSASHSPNLDLCRTLGNRSSIRSIDRVYDGADFGYNGDLPASLRSLDMNRGIHSSHSSIDRKHRGADEMSVHSVSRAYEPTYYSENIGRSGDESSVRSYNMKKGSNLSLRSEENARYGGGRDSRRGSDASLLGLGSTLPMQRRPFNVSNEYGIANISESE